MSSGRPRLQIVKALLSALTAAWATAMSSARVLGLTRACLLQTKTRLREGCLTSQLRSRLIDSRAASIDGGVKSERIVRLGAS